MATFTGSGKFVGIAAGYNQYFPESTSESYGYGISFGADGRVYCSVGSRYYMQNNEIVKTSLAVEANTNKDGELIDYSLLTLQFPSLQRLRVNNNLGYTGTIRVISRIDCDENYENPDTPVYATYRFKCGLLVQRTDNT